MSLNQTIVAAELVLSILLKHNLTEGVYNQMQVLQTLKILKND